jgi:hypothetical protein
MAEFCADNIKPLGFTVSGNYELSVMHFEYHKFLQNTNSVQTCFNNQRVILLQRVEACSLIHLKFVTSLSCHVYHEGGWDSQTDKGTISHRSIMNVCHIRMCFTFIYYFKSGGAETEYSKYFNILKERQQWA